MTGRLKFLAAAFGLVLATGTIASVSAETLAKTQPAKTQAAETQAAETQTGQPAATGTVATRSVASVGAVRAKAPATTAQAKIGHGKRARLVALKGHRLHVAQLRRAHKLHVARRHVGTHLVKAHLGTRTIKQAHGVTARERHAMNHRVTAAKPVSVIR